MTGIRRESRKRGLERGVWPAAALLVLTIAVYSPSFSGGFVWDDDANVTGNATLRSVGGLADIWLDPHANQQYYPLTHTTFWVEYRLFGARPFPYHLANVLLHAASAIALLALLRRLAVPGAWLGAAVFAVHPLQVESVAWVTERKNVLSGLILLLSALAFFRDADRRGWSPAATALFALALTAKTAVATAPFVLLAVLGWKRGRIGARELLPVSPMAALGIGAGCITAWLERHHVGAAGESFALDLPSRILLAGRSLWFYAGKFVWPAGQIFIYPREAPAAGGAVAWLLPLTAAAVPMGLFVLRRRIGLGPFVGVVAYGLLVAPASGFFDLYFFRYSFVQDHFQYFGCMALAALAGAAVAGAASRPVTHVAIAGAILLALGASSWDRTHVFRDSETLWADTLEKNPRAWMAHVNMAGILFERGRRDEALAHYAAALAHDPFRSDAAVAAGCDLVARGRVDEGVDAIRRAMAERPYGKEALDGIGVVLAASGRIDEALVFFDSSVRADPGFASAHVNRGLALERLGRRREALEAFREVVRVDPRDRNARARLTAALRSATSPD